MRAPAVERVVGLTVPDAAPLGAAAPAVQPAPAAEPAPSAGSPTTSVHRWTDVCALDDLLLDRGACLLVGSHHVALFRLTGGDVYALSNHDPFGGASVLSRGIVGSSGERLTVASPLHKQRFDLCTGECLDDPTVSVPVFAARVVGGRVEVGLP